MNPEGFRAGGAGGDQVLCGGWDPLSHSFFRCMQKSNSLALTHPGLSAL